MLSVRLDLQVSNKVRRFISSLSLHFQHRLLWWVITYWSCPISASCGLRNNLLYAKQLKPPTKSLIFYDGRCSGQSLTCFTETIHIILRIICSALRGAGATLYLPPVGHLVTTEMNAKMHVPVPHGLCWLGNCTCVLLLWLSRWNDHPLRIWCSLKDFASAIRINTNRYSIA